MAAPIFPNKAAAASYWAKHPNDPLNPNRSPGAGGAWGPDGKVVTPSKAPKVVKKAPPVKSNNRDALIAKYIAGLTSSGQTGTMPDLSQQLPGTPDFSMYTGDTVPDYGSSVKDSQFGAFKQGAYSSVDPKTYARIAGEAYTPLLNTLKQQQAGYQAGQAAGNQQIEGAYGAASDLATQARDRILGSGAAAQASSQAATAGLVGSTGNDPIAAAAATQAQSANDRLSGALSGIDAQGAADSGAAAQRQKAASLLDYGNAVSDKTNALGLQAGQLQVEQGQSKQKALMDALSFNDTMKSNGLNRDVTAQSAKLASSLAGGQITAQNLANAGARAGLSEAAIKSLMDKTQFNNSVQQDKFNNMITKVNSVASLKQLAKAGTAAGLDVTTLPKASAAMVDDTTYGNLESQIVQPYLGGDGVSVNDPRKVYDAAFTAINQLDGKTPKPVRAALARRMTTGILAKYNSKNNTDWYWNGTTFAQRPKK